jgi:hypothetical protein
VADVEKKLPWTLMSFGQDLAVEERERPFARRTDLESQSLLEEVGRDFGMLKMDILPLECSPKTWILLLAAAGEVLYSFSWLVATSCYYLGLLRLGIQW